MNKFINEPRSTRLLKGVNAPDSRLSAYVLESSQDYPEFCNPENQRKLPRGWKNEESDSTPKKASLRPSSAIFDSHKVESVEEGG